MKKKLGILLLIIGIILFSIFLLLTITFIYEGIQDKYFETLAIINCGGVTVIGLLITIGGAILLDNRKKKKGITQEKWMNQKEGQTFVKLGGKYRVGYPTFSIYVYSFLILFWIALWLFLLIAIYIQTGKIEYFYVYISFLFLCLFICVCYFLKRPEIKVNENTFIIYPRWEKQKIIHLTDINDRKIRRNWQGQILISYFHDQDELFQIHSNFVNWKRLDMNVYIYLTYRKNEKKDD